MKPNLLLALLLIGISVVPQVANSDVIGGINFPKTLDGFELRQVIDNEVAQPGLGKTIFYNRPGVNASVYVYNGRQRNIPDGADSAVVKEHFQIVSKDVVRAHAGAQTLVASEKLNVGGVAILHSSYQYVEEIPGKRELVFSHVYLTAKNGNFIKIRTTVSAVDQPERGHRAQINFVEALADLLRR